MAAAERGGEAAAEGGGRLLEESLCEGCGRYWSKGTMVSALSALACLGAGPAWSGGAGLTCASPRPCRPISLSQQLRSSFLSTLALSALSGSFFLSFDLLSTAPASSPLSCSLPSAHSQQPPLSPLSLSAHWVCLRDVQPRACRCLPIHSPCASRGQAGIPSESWPVGEQGAGEDAKAAAGGISTIVGAGGASFWQRHRTREPPPPSPPPSFLYLPPFFVSLHRQLCGPSLTHGLCSHGAPLCLPPFWFPCTVHPFPFVVSLHPLCILSFSHSPFS